jgi:hypothetical protein
MDGLFVDQNCDPYKYIFVEAKSSILPTKTTRIKSHRSGILKQMLDSLNGYDAAEPRMEMIRIRENLDKSFSESERRKIRSDLRVPGPEMQYLGVSVTNAVTVNDKDDDFILSSPCNIGFNYYGVVVTNVEKLTSESYKTWDAVKKAIKKS